MKRSLLPAAAIVISTVLYSADAGAVMYYTKGHGDIGVSLGNGELSLHYHFDGSAVLDGVADPNDSSHAPADIITVLSEPPIQRPEGPDFDFIGNSVGDSLWVISAAQDFMPENPWLGFSTEEIPFGDILGNVTFTVESVRGPGAFAVFALGPAGEPIVSLSSALGIGSFELPANIHAHYFMSFTAGGVYEIDLAARVMLPDGGTLSDSGTFTFQVGAIPEPTALGSLGLFALAGLARRSRSGMSASRQCLA